MALFANSRKTLEIKNSNIKKTRANIDVCPTMATYFVPQTGSNP